MSILDTLADLSRKRARTDQAVIPETEMRARVKALGRGNGEAFLSARKKPGISFICEIKRASPSKGMISPDFPYMKIAGAYERAGADCISCLTEPEYFLGSDRIFREIRSAVSLPMLRKDFTVSAYQLDQARLMGANAALLIVSLLDESTLAAYLERCEELGIAALVDLPTGQAAVNHRGIGALVRNPATGNHCQYRSVKTFFGDNCVDDGFDIADLCI